MIRSLGVTTPAKSACGSEDSSNWRLYQSMTFLPLSTLCDEIPSELCLDDFLAYFSRTWLRGFAAGRSARFPPACWNVLNRTSCHLNRSKNYLEAWNKQFAIQVGHSHQTMWNFLATMFMKQSSTEDNFLEGNGDQPPRRKKRHVKPMIWLKPMIGIN